MRDCSIILASQSPRRRELLSEIINDFQIEPALCKEDAQGSPEHVVLQQGYQKALDVFSRHEDALVIGADTVVTIDGLILGKPRDSRDAVRMLKLLSGRVHRVLTGMCVISKEGCAVSLDETLVSFRVLDDDEIERYICTGEPMDKAGAYAIQGLGGAFVKSYEGDYDNAIGMCVKSLENILTSKFQKQLKPREHARR